MRRFVLVLALCGGCATQRFLDRSIVWIEHDDRPAPKPRARRESVHRASIDVSIFLPIDRALAIDYGGEARNVNALDEVPDSAWFEDPRRDPHQPRPRALTAEAMRLGVSRPEDTPVPPLTVWKTKSIGSTPGFVAKDARGVRYVVKLDGPGPVGLSTSAEVVASRLFWAGGWRVPSIGLIELQPEQIRWVPGLRRKDSFGDDEPYTLAMHERLLARTPRQDGKIRALVSRWLEGEVLGSFAFHGRRDDDPNDRYPHEDRRELRGMGVFAAWVNDVDTLENNTLDVFVGDKGTGHLVHYQQDVGGCFGTWAAAIAPAWMGQATYFDAGRIVVALATLGVRPQAWEGDAYTLAYRTNAVAWPELGGFEADHFDPRTWTPVIPNPAFDRATDRDRYWGAKRVLAFSEAELRAAIEAGHYPPRTAERLFQVLWERRRRIGQAYLTRIAALDYFRLDADRLCFDDLYVQAELGGPGRYRARAASRTLPIRWQGSEGCVALEAQAGYRVIELGVQRAWHEREKKVRVHLMEDARGRRVIGVER